MTGDLWANRDAWLVITLGARMATEKKKKRADTDKVGLAALAALVVGLAVVVYLAVPKDSDLQAAADAGPWSGLGTDGSARVAPSPAEPTDGHSLERLAEATCELAILSDKAEVDVAKVASAENIAKLLDVRHCGATCDALKKQIVDHDHFEVEIMKSEDYILPPKESFDTIAPGLTPAERASITQRSSTIVIRARGAATIDQMPARVAFAATAVVAEALAGIVYDEVVRRIETPAQFFERVIKVPLGQNVFTPKQISVQLYRQEDGTARILTLGMGRFGSPDFTMRGSAIEVGPSLANVVNVVASRAASGKTDVPIVISLADIARVAAHTPEEMAKDPKGRRSVSFEPADWERVEGDPENEMLEIVPPGGPTVEAWASAITNLLGETPKIVFTANDKELDAIAARARRELPSAVKRFEGGEGTLFVKGPFPIPEGTHIDGGAKEEWMWIEVASCDAKGCAGVLSNTPGYATNLSAGTPVSVAREKTADWLLRAKDGGTAGGESIKVLQKRIH